MVPRDRCWASSSLKCFLVAGLQWFSSMGKVRGGGLQRVCANCSYCFENVQFSLCQLTWTWKPCSLSSVLGIQKSNVGVYHQPFAICFVSFLMCAGSYDGEIIVWNNSTENALRILRPLAELGEGEKSHFHTQMQLNSTNISFYNCKVNVSCFSACDMSFLVILYFSLLCSTLIF